MPSLNPRMVVIGTVALLIVAFLIYAFTPRAISTDIITVQQAPLMVSIKEEAKTRVDEAFIVSAPVSGRLLRVSVEPGDGVVEAETVVARIAPANPTVLDVRTEEQANANVDAAIAALDIAKADVNKAAAEVDYARAAVKRARELHPNNAISKAQLDETERRWRSSLATLDVAKATVSLREADLKNARAMLMHFSDNTANATTEEGNSPDLVALRAPITGRVLRVMQESETTVTVGTPIMEIGDPMGDLEIVAELLSTDAVKIKEGNRVIIDKWGGPQPLQGVVKRVEPWGFTKYSALGVEEQRVNAVIGFTGDTADHAALGHGFRTEVQIVLWEDPQALQVPMSALFRVDGQWSVFKAVRGKAALSTVEIGQTNGQHAEVLSGLQQGDEVVLYPGTQISNGIRIKKRAI